MKLLSFIAILVATGKCIAGPTAFWALKPSGEGANWRAGIVTRDDGYLLLGSEWEPNARATLAAGYPDEILRVRLVRLRGDGALQWMENYGDAARSVALSLGATPDGGYCVLAGAYPQERGMGDGHLWVFKIDGLGGKIWDLHLPGAYQATGLLFRPYETFSVAGTKDGGCAVAGGTATERSNRIQVRVVLISAAGKLLWDHEYGPEPSSIAFTVAATDTGFLVAGVAKKGEERATDALMLKLNKEGRLLSEHRYGDTNAKLIVHHILPLADGGALLSGSKLVSTNSRQDAWALRVDRDGFETWSRTFGTNSGDFFFGARQGQEGRFDLFGASGPRGAPHQALIVGISERGEALVERRLDQPLEQLTGIVPLADSGYLLFGATLRGSGLAKVGREDTPR